MALSDNIRLNRERMKLSQEELGGKIGVTPQQIYKYEKGIRIPNAIYAVMLAETFGTTVEKLVKGESE